MNVLLPFQRGELNDRFSHKYGRYYQTTKSSSRSAIRDDVGKFFVFSNHYCEDRTHYVTEELLLSIFTYTIIVSNLYAFGVELSTTKIRNENWKSYYGTVCLLWDCSVTIHRVIVRQAVAVRVRACIARSTNPLPPPQVGLGYSFSPVWGPVKTFCFVYVVLLSLCLRPYRNVPCTWSLYYILLTCYGYK